MSMSKVAVELQPLISHLVSEGRPLVEHYGYAGLVLTNLVEGMGLPLPGQTFLIAAAVLSAEGDLSMFAVLALTFASALGGSCVGYWIGRTGGRALLLRCNVPPARLERLESVVARRGVIVVAVARFVDGLRQLTPLVAGSLEMPWWRFFVACAAGSAAWVLVWGIGMYSIAEHSGRILVGLHGISAAGWWLTGLLAAGLLTWLFWRRR
jgi:membrane protein DedA with SNARE-associated domain